MRLYSVGVNGDPKIFLMYACFSRFISCIVSNISWLVGFAGSGDIRFAALWLGASTTLLVKAVAGYGVNAEKFNDMPLGTAVNADETNSMPFHSDQPPMPNKLLPRRIPCSFLGNTIVAVAMRPASYHDCI